MLELILVLREGRVDLEEKPEGGQLRVGERWRVCLYAGPGPYFDGRFYGRHTTASACSCTSARQLGRRTSTTVLEKNNFV